MHYILLTCLCGKHTNRTEPSQVESSRVCLFNMPQRQFHLFCIESTGLYKGRCVKFRSLFCPLWQVITITHTYVTANAGNNLPLRISRIAAMLQTILLKLQLGMGNVIFSLWDFNTLYTRWGFRCSGTLCYIVGEWFHTFRRNVIFPSSWAKELKNVNCFESLNLED